MTDYLPSTNDLRRLTVQTIKELLSQCYWFTRTLYAMADKMDEMDKRIYALEENRKQKDAAILDLQQKVSMLKILDRKGASK